MDSLPYMAESAPSSRLPKDANHAGPSTHSRRRSFASISPFSAANSPQKVRKVSRACDFCKARKAKCSGTQPCAKCVARGTACVYNAKYTRGRPPTPPPSVRTQLANDITIMGEERDEREQNSYPLQSISRASPELGMAEIQGQVFDPTSGLTFLHRAWKRLSAREQKGSIADVDKMSAELQTWTMAGDRPLPERDEYAPLNLPGPAEARRLLALYFEVCIATYRILHRPTVEWWLSIIEKNLAEGRVIWHDLGHSRAAIVMATLAIATTHDEKSKGFFGVDEDIRSISLSDEFFGLSYRLAQTEQGYPKLESAQCRLVQVLYLLTTSRFNKGWYVFGEALQIISTIGLHRKANLKRRRTAPKTDYIYAQCQSRTFWTAYILDTYLGVIFGRPRHFHDDDIDQEFPDRANDEDMSPVGPIDGQQSPEDCHIDALILHAKIGQIIGCMSREVYTIKDISDQDRVAAAQKLIQRVDAWRESLPLHLGSIRPSMLIPPFRRQATILKLAYSHAIMHASRPFLLGNFPAGTPSISEGHVENCISAAKSVLDTVDNMAREGPIFHAFWWTHYVTFCALVVVYVWEIQQRRMARFRHDNDRRTSLLELAEKCQSHLALATATNSPSRRYAVILEEFRAAATQEGTQGKTGSAEGSEGEVEAMTGSLVQGADQSFYDPHPLDTWQTADWLELDSSAFWPNMNFDEAMTWPAVSA